MYHWPPELYADVGPLPTCPRTLIASGLDELSPSGGMGYALCTVTVDIPGSAGQ
jgi:hypothetical protein